jgi:SNF family Na+-dependent transporter
MIGAVLSMWEVVHQFVQLVCHFVSVVLFVTVPLLIACLCVVGTGQTDQEVVEWVAFFALVVFAWFHWCLAVVVPVLHPKIHSVNSFDKQ